MATETFGPFDTLPWADQTQWYRFAPAWARSGVIDVPAASASAGGLGLTFSGLTPTIAVGRAWARGAGYELSGGAKTLAAIAANTNSTLYRQDRLVLRRDLAAKTVSIVALPGTPSSTPTPPALTQVETGQWDTTLFSFLVPPASGSTITGIVDERSFTDAGGGQVAGTVVSYGSVTTNLATDGTATEQRIAGGLNQAPVLTAGRAYKVKARGVLNGNFAGAQVSFNVRGVIGTGTPTNSSTCVGSVGAGIDTVGAAGRIPLALEAIFNASTSGTCTISPFMKASSGVLTLVTDDRGRADLWVEDAGLAVSGAVSL